MKVSSLVAIAAACNVSVDFLATGNESKTVWPDIALLSPEILAAPAHFWSLIVLSSACQEFYNKAAIRPSLLQALEWISPNYINGMRLPDMPVNLKPGKEPSA
jgi:hypothetical protein